MRYGTTMHRTRGSATVGLLVGAAIATVAVGGAVWLLSGVESASNAIGSSDLFIVERGQFEITIPASGNLVAQEQVEIRNLLDDSAIITEIVAEGEPVNAGDVLIRLDDKDVRERITTAKETLVQAKAAVESDSANKEIAEKSRESSLSAAQVAVDQAELGLLAWRKGEVVSKRNALRLAIRTASKDYKRLADKYTKSLELRDRDFISQNDLEQDEIAMIRADAALSKAQLDQEVYEAYTFQKEEQAMASAKQQAIGEQERINTRTAAQVRSATTQLEASRANELSKKERLERYLTQLEATTVFAPSSGMVVYGSTVQRDRRGENESAFRVGSSVHRNQLLIVLPDVSRMAAEVKVNEALSGLVTPGQRALIRTDALPDEIFEGSVHSIGVLAQDGGWRDPNRRDYQVRINLDGTGDSVVKPSMRCTAHILVETVQDALFVPVHAVHRRGRQIFVHRRAGDVFDEHPIEIGRSSDLYVEVTSGLDDQDEVLLRKPPPGSIRNRLEDELADTG
jgi:multidrug efflux pump subunit AcrA (membrane-fusion protein)